MITKNGKNNIPLVREAKVRQMFPNRFVIACIVAKICNQNNRADAVSGKFCLVLRHAKL